MKISLLQQDLLPHLQAVSRSVGIRSNLPVLDNILLSTDGSKLKIVATNLEIGVIKTIPAEIIEPGDITVPAKTIVELIAGLKIGQIELESTGDILTVVSGKFRATINGISSTEFPVIPQGEGSGINFKKDTLISCGQILFAAAVDDGRPTLTGILTSVSGENVDFIATDGFRLAHRQVKLETKSGDFKSLIPKKTFEEVLRIIGEEDVEEINITTSENQNQVVFKINQTIISSRLIEGNYPSWEKIIPTETITRVILAKEDILKGAKLAAIFAKSEGFVTLKLTKDGLVLESSAKELGSQQNEVEATIEGEDLTIAFNAKFLTDAIVNIPTTQLVIEFSGALTPALIKPMGLVGLEFVIMPVKIN